MPPTERNARRLVPGRSARLKRVGFALLLLAAAWYTTRSAMKVAQWGVAMNQQGDARSTLDHDIRNASYQGDSADDWFSTSSASDNRPAISEAGPTASPDVEEDYLKFLLSTQDRTSARGDDLSDPSFVNDQKPANRAGRQSEPSAETSDFGLTAPIVDRTRTDDDGTTSNAERKSSERDSNERTRRSDSERGTSRGAGEPSRTAESSPAPKPTDPSPTQPQVTNDRTPAKTETLETESSLNPPRTPERERHHPDA